MKRTVILLICIVMIISMAACTGEIEENNMTTGQATEQVNDQVTGTETENNSSETVKWREFITDYSEWVDKYIALVKKSKDNPSDLSILSEYTTMAQEISEWSTRSEEVKEDLLKASPKEVAEYSEELLKIAKKLAEAY